MSTEEVLVWGDLNGPACKTVEPYERVFVIRRKHVLPKEYSAPY